MSISAAAETLLLTAGQARAVILPRRGALLTSLTFGNGEVLWLPPDFAEAQSGWPGGGIPVLFPFAGRVFHQGQAFLYDLDGTVRTMPIHGFAYAMPWSVDSKTPSKVRLTTRDTDATEALFPFAFELSLVAELSPQLLTMTLTATHRGTAAPAGTALQAMPLACGFHPYFRIPGTADGASARLKLHAGTKIQVTPAGGAGKPAPFVVADAGSAGIPLSDPITTNVILADHSRRDAALFDEKSREGVTISWGDDKSPLKHLVLWRKPGEGFQCVEPWMGLPDVLQNGAGLMRLLAEESIEATITIKPFNENKPS